MKPIILIIIFNLLMIKCLVLICLDIYKEKKSTLPYDYQFFQNLSFHYSCYDFQLFIPDVKYKCQCSFPFISIFVVIYIFGQYSQRHCLTGLYFSGKIMIAATVWWKWCQFRVKQEWLHQSARLDESMWLLCLVISFVVRVYQKNTVYYTWSQLPSLSFYWLIHHCNTCWYYLNFCLPTLYHFTFKHGPRLLQRNMSFKQQNVQ